VIEHTEPLTIRFDSCIGKVFILILEGLDLAFLVTIGSVFVHLETANCGGGPLLGLGIIAAVGVVGVLWFSRDVNGSLFLLRHCRDRQRRDAKNLRLGFATTEITVPPRLIFCGLDILVFFSTIL
jgi:hypothetical protein